MLTQPATGYAVFPPCAHGTGMEAPCELSPAEVTTAGGISRDTEEAGEAKPSWSCLLCVHCDPPPLWQLRGWCEELVCTKARLPLCELPKTTSIPKAEASQVFSQCVDPANDRELLSKAKSMMPNPTEEAENEAEAKHLPPPRLPKAPSSLALSTSRDGTSTASLGSLCQGLTTL